MSERFAGLDKDYGIDQYPRKYLPIVQAVAGEFSDVVLVQPLEIKTWADAQNVATAMVATDLPCLPADELPSVLFSSRDNVVPVRITYKGTFTDEFDKRLSAEIARFDAHRRGE